MDNQLLPSYLRNSTVLNKLSIQQLLQYWAIVCAAAVVLLSLVAVFTNDFISTSHERLASEVIPIAKLSRNLNRTIAGFIDRKNHIISSVTNDELVNYLERGYLEKQYASQIKPLSLLVSDLEGGSDIISKLQSSYKEFLDDDSAVTKSVLEILQREELLERKAVNYQEMIVEPRNTIEAMTGIISLDISRARFRLMGDASVDVTQKDHLLTLFNNQTRIQQVNNNIRQGMVNMELFGRDIIHATDKDELLILKDNRVFQESSLVEHEIEILKKIVTDYPNLSDKIEELDESFAQLLHLLINSSESIYNLRFDLLERNHLLSENIGNINYSAQLILIHIEELFVIADKFTNAAAVDSRNITRVNLFVVVIVSMLVIAVITGGIMLVIYRINQPLLDLKTAMRDLSSGDMSRRLKASDVVVDEFSELSVDFNRFAERTQSLIDEVSSAKNALEQSDKRTRAILENALVGIANIQGRKFLSVNRKFEEIFGFERHEILDIGTEIIFPTEHDYEAIGDAAYHLLANGEIYQGEWQLKRKDGSLFWGNVSAKSIVDNRPDEGTIWLYEDITQRKENEKELRLLANYDILTGLPNRSLFHDRLGQELERAARYKNNVALMFIDLDRFKTINDSFGHAAGDELLKQVAKRLSACVRGSDTVSRLGGDEFTIILPDVEMTIATSKVAEKIIQIMAEPIILQGQEVRISPSIGISLFPDDAGDFATLLQNADAAMYYAKSEGRNNYQFYTKKMNAEAREELLLVVRLRHAIEAEEFRLHYHPQVDVATRQVIGYEALIRWYVEGDKIIYPGAFMSVLEDTGMIVEVGDWILRTACKEAKQLLAKNKALKHISVNLSARQFAHNNLAGRIETILDETGLPPECLVLEITETVLLTETHQTQKILDELHALGLQLSLDDFGTGYSSLAYLKRFPIDIIKIDQSFIRDIHTDPAICEAILAMAHRLDLDVVAEGVETESQFDFLAKSQCHTVQGNLFGEPEPLENIINI